LFRRCLLVGLTALSGIGMSTVTASAEPPIPPAGGLPDALKLDEAVRWSLQNNPELAAFRQQHGIAAAAVVIARTYPFNPVWTNKPFAVNGPESAGITNRVAMEQRVSIDLEVRGQGAYRREAACAALTRTDWEIAFQETTIALRVIRAFNAELYYQGKLRLGEETIRLNEQTVQELRQLLKREAVQPADLIVAESEVASSRALLGTARAALVRARQDLRRALGVTEEAFALQGALDTPLPATDDLQTLVPMALDRRPDLHARQFAVQEADARVRLARADRFGNPNLGPDYEYNETRANFIGAQLTLPLPVFNTRRGEILQREAERTRAAFDLRNAEVVVRQDVQGALDRLREARAWADTYRTKVLPNLEESRKTMQTLFAKGGVPALSVIDIQRKLLRARDGYLDALYELRQAQADLAAAMGDPGLAIAP
jgi:cobalt-zinc-cadmium efflux system outer membrane protein